MIKNVCLEHNMDTNMDKQIQNRIHTWIEKSLIEEGNGPFSELIRLYKEKPVRREPLDTMLKKIENREDCADFQVAGFIRMMYQFSDSSLVPDDMWIKIQDVLLGFKYWPDEPGSDCMCSWSENHYILFSSAAYLAGQKFKNRGFINSGLTGKEMETRFLPRIRKWLDLRFATGFSEWLSNVYYNEDLPALFNLADFAENSEIRNKATMLIDLLLTDLALNSYRGIFASSHGRSYENNKKYSYRESTASLSGLLFGGEVFHQGNFGAVSFILSSYKLPGIIPEMADHHETEIDENRQISGFDIDTAEKLGLNRKNPEDGMLFLTGEAYAHPRFIHSFVKMLDSYNWWKNSFFKPLRAYKGLLKVLDHTALISPFFKILEKDVARGYRGPAHIYTCRSPYYMMSSALNYRPGFGGDQQSVWQVTLGGDATCFITHPGKAVTTVNNETPNYWTGYGTLPSVAQYRNCAIMIYRINTKPGLYLNNRILFTHAWFPKKEFDRVTEEGNWIFGMKEDSYIALWSQHNTEWGNEGDGKCELIARGKNNIWICQAGSKDEFGSFQEFVNRISASKLKAGKSYACFDSPGNGNLEYKWNGPLRVKGLKTSLNNINRYENIFGRVPYPSKTAEFSSESSYLRLNWQSGERNFSQ